MWNLKNKAIKSNAILFMCCVTLNFFATASEDNAYDSIENTELDFTESDAPGSTGSGDERNNGPVSPGIGYAPTLTNDIQRTGGVLSFVAKKPTLCQKDKKCCEKLVIALTPEAIKDNVSIELYFHNRYPENNNWKQADEKLQVTRISPKSPNELITILYNHAGHKGVHGGGTAKDTHHNWQLRLLKNGTRIGSSLSLWHKYLRILYSTADHNLEEEYSGVEGLESANDQNNTQTGAFLTAGEIDKLVNWGFFTDQEQIELLQSASAELKENNEIASGEKAGQASFSAVIAAGLGALSMKFIQGVGNYLGSEATFWVLGGIKNFFSASQGCGTSSSSLTIDKDASGKIIRYNVILAK